MIHEIFTDFRVFCLFDLRVENVIREFDLMIVGMFKRTVFKPETKTRRFVFEKYTVR